jgi:hypothetical protein
VCIRTATGLKEGTLTGVNIRIEAINTGRRRCKREKKCEEVQGIS